MEPATLQLIGAIVIVVILLIHIMIHECGHGFVANKIAGRAIESVSIGFLCPEDFRFTAWGKPIFIGIFPLLGSVNPVKEEEMSRLHYLLYCLAGPLVNIVVSIVLIVLVLGPALSITILGLLVPVIGLSYTPEIMARSVTDAQAWGNSASIVGGIIYQNPLPGFGLWFALIGLSMGFMNLLPIPMLDGGTFLFTPLTWAVPVLTKPMKVVFMAFLILFAILIGVQVFTIAVAVLSIALIYIAAIFALCMMIRVIRAHRVWKETGKPQYNEDPWILHFIPLPRSLRIPLPRFQLAPLFRFEFTRLCWFRLTQVFTD